MAETRTPNRGAPAAAPGGLNALPRRLREKLPDWLAGSVVIVTTGLAMTLLLAVLILIFPA